MKVFYEGSLNGEQVKVDEVNVCVDATRYPVRNISMVHVGKAKRPNLLTAMLLRLVGLLLMLYPPLAISMTAIESIGRLQRILSEPESYGIFALSIGGGFLLRYFALGLVKVPFHSVQFGNSGNDRDVVVLYPMSKEDLRPYVSNIFRPLDWESLSAPSYQEITKFANAVSDSIDSFQNQSQSSN